MNPTILNREFQHPSDGWYQIEAKGEHPNRAAGVVQVIDDEATASIVNRFNADASAGKLRHGSEMLIDHEHFSDQPDQETRAYGWLQELQNRGDGVYGRIRWTKTGKEAVDGGDYRFFSTEYLPEDLQPVKNRTGQTGKTRQTAARPMRLGGLTLTNMNNNRGQKPITNRGPDLTGANRGNRGGKTFTEGNEGNEEFRRGLEAGAGNKTNQTKTKNKMKNIATMLALSAEASEEAILAEVTKLTNRLSEAEKKVTPLTNRVTALEAENGTLLGEQIDGLLAEHGIKEQKLINRLRPMLTPLKNREDRLACIADLGIKPAQGGTQRKLSNRDTKAPGADAAAGGEDDQARSAKITNRANELRAANGNRSWDECWNSAVRELTVQN